VSDDRGAAIDGERDRWLAVAGASAMSVSLGAYELVPASVTPLIRESLSIGNAGAGLLVSVMFGTAVLASVPVGIGLDRTNSRSAIAVAVGALLVAGVWGWAAASAGSFAGLLASRVLGGLAYVVVWNAGIDVVGRAFPPDRQATAVATFTASGPVGFAVGQGTGPLVAGALGWPAVFPVYTGLAVVGLAAFWPASRGSGRVAGGEAPSPAQLRAVLTNPQVLLVGALGFLGYALYLFVNSWAPSYLTEELALSLGLAGLVVAAFPAVGVLSRVSGGVLSDRLFGGRRRPVVLWSFLIAAPTVAALTVPGSVAAVVVLLLVAGAAIQLCLGLVFAYVRELVAPATAATAVAVLTSVGLAGAFVAPIAGGAVVSTFGYPAAFGLAGALGALGAGLAWLAPEPA
jgi:predicted MFS family arabinose efflux permease